jgi:hypothetical protein
VTGAAYVYQRVDDQWVLPTKLFAPDGQFGEIFGTSAAVDGHTVVIGAPGAVTSDGTRAGAVYVFRLVAGRSVAAWGSAAVS